MLLRLWLPDRTCVPVARSSGRDSPVNKAAFAAAGLGWKGHTDLLAHLCGVGQVAMMFHSPKLRVVLATVHVPLRDVPRLLTRDLILGTLIGGVGYLLRVMNFPIAPFILGFVLGDMMEQNLRRALSISDGDVGVLFASPISIGLWVAAAAMLLGPRLMRMMEQRKAVAA